MKPRVLILCAPFGFGPAAKALVVAHALRDSAEIALCADRDAYRFICQYRPSPTMRVMEGVSRTVKDPRELSAFDFFINIGHAPALGRLHRFGLAGRTVFIDSLLLWRTDNKQAPIPNGLLAYLAEDHPGAAERLHPRAAATVAVTAPLMWPIEASAVPRTRREMVSHLGGVTSPLAPWETIAGPAGKIVAHVARQAACHGRSLAVIGSAHLKSLALPAGEVNIAGDVSPETSARLIAGAQLLVTTPGIGAVYEAMARDIPVILLPPMNSTQLHHYQVFTGRGMHGTAPPELSDRLAAQARKVGWEQQTGICLRALCADTDALVSELPGLVRSLLESPANAVEHDCLMQGQRQIFASFSRTDAIDILKSLLEKPPGTRPAAGGAQIRGKVSVPPGLSLEKQLRLMPKAEFHVHMEGAIAPSLLLRLAERNKLRLPFSDPGQYSRMCGFGGFRDFARIFMLSVHCLRTPEDFFDVVAHMGREMARQNIRYAEVTWTPQLYLSRSVPLDGILGAMNEARRRIKSEWGVEIRWIADLLRSHPGPALSIVNWACGSAARAGGVVAVGLGGPESGFPASAFAAHFEKARSAGLPANPHAGEGVGPASVWETIEQLKPSRIGHGVRSIEDSTLVDHLVRHATPLELCLTSNIKLGVYASYAEHPVKRLADAGCRISINTDDPALFQTTLSEEYLHAIRDCGLDLAFVKRSILDGLRASYLGADEKSAMLAALEGEFETASRPH
jgi:aminodeoxyfutalosine deaminase